MLLSSIANVSAIEICVKGVKCLIQKKAIFFYFSLLFGWVRDRISIYKLLGFLHNLAVALQATRGSMGVFIERKEDL